jgi:hypothetical protein
MNADCQGGESNEGGGRQLRKLTLTLFLATDPEVRVRFPALPDFLRSYGSGTRSTQPREDS